MKIDLVVTRHGGLVQYLLAEGIIGEDTPVMTHAHAEDLEGKDVLGVLPVHLAAYCATLSVVPLEIPAELRGQELNEEQVRQYAGPVTHYVVQEYGVACPSCGYF